MRRLILKRKHTAEKNDAATLEENRHGGRLMPSNKQYLFLIALLCPSWTLAATIHRCETTNGRLTFTTLGCGSEETFSLQDVKTFPPGSAMTGLIPEADYRETPRTEMKTRDPTVVGKAEDKCGNLISAAERREAIMNRRIIAGMTQQDVESALGKPDKINIRNSSTSYRYVTKRGRSAHIEFDERGCTKGKAKSQTAKSPQ
jgi:hypothetical protein